MADPQITGKRRDAERELGRGSAIGEIDHLSGCWPLPRHTTSTSCMLLRANRESPGSSSAKLCLTAHPTLYELYARGAWPNVIAHH